MNKTLYPNFEEYVKPIHQRVDLFITQVLSCFISTTADFKELLSGISILSIKEKHKIETIYPNKNTQHKYFTHYRNSLKDLDLPDTFLSAMLSIFKLSTEDSDARSFHRDSVIDLKANNVALFDLPVFLTTCNEFLLNLHQDPYTLVIGLMGLTGRRPIEILKTAQFKYHDPHHLLFSGQAKTKNSPHAQSSYVIPVLAEPTLIIEALKKVRSHFPLSHWHNNQVISIFSPRLIRKVRPLRSCLFPHEHISLTCRSLRSLYVTTAYHLFNIATKASFNAFAAKVLGHSHLDKNTANSYTFYAIAPSTAIPQLKTMKLEEAYI